MGTDVLAQIARELVTTMQRDIKTDWTVRDDVRSKLRSSIKRLLVKYRYPPDKQPEAVRLVFEQIEQLPPTYTTTTHEGSPVPESLKPHPDMSDYEVAAWDQLIERARRHEGRRQRPAVKKVSELAEAANERLENFFDDHENVQSIAEAFAAPFAGLQGLLTRLGASSVSDKRVVRRAARRDPKITSLAGLRAADLEISDRLLVRHNLTYSLVMAAEGAATSLAVTGFVVSSTVSGGTTLAAAAGAVATDVTANLAAASRLVAKIAISYGYDPRLPDEQLYALGVMNYGTTVTAGGKAASLAELSRLVQVMMRHPNHVALDKFVLIKVTKEFLKRLGFRVAHQRLAQLVPFVGVVVNAGTNATSISVLGDRAQDAYRLRFLTEKYNLDPAAWLADDQGAGAGALAGAGAVAGAADADRDDESIDIDALIQEAEAELLETDGQPGA